MASSVVLQVGACGRMLASPVVVNSRIHGSHFQNPQSSPLLLPLVKYDTIGLSFRDKPGVLRWTERQVGPAVGAASRAFEPLKEPSSSGESEDEGVGVSSQTWEDQTEQPEAGGLVSSPAPLPLQTLSKDAAMGIVLRAAGTCTGWTTGSGLEGPSYSMEIAGSEMPDPILSKSPRRRMRVAFTCNVCGHRTTRAINPHAYTDGTVFVQCGGCDVFHKLVDNLKLFHELRGQVYRGYGDCFDIGFHQPYEFLD